MSEAKRAWMLCAFTAALLAYGLLVVWCAREERRDRKERLDRIESMQHEIIQKLEEYRK